MITDQLQNPTVKAAIRALQEGDKVSWMALFAPNADLLDDGNPRSLSAFTDEAIGNERFVTIDAVTNGGLNLEGTFHTKSWGDFRTYFRFHLNAEGKITRLEIGQAD
ncbi:MAG TPA: hypothetical protein VGM68_06725 [Rhizomicrobium sp.]|jgi:hypothetical protein